MAMSGQSVFDLIEDLLATDITTEQVDTRTEPSTTSFVVEAVVEHPLSKEREDSGAEVNVAMENIGTSISAIVQTSARYMDWKGSLKASIVAYKSWRLKLMN
jgi:hypothetical protein